MATSDDAHSEGHTGGTTGTALTPTTDAGIGPFIAAAADSAKAPARGLGSRLLDYSAHAAIIVGLAGFAWTVSSHLATRPTAAQIESPIKTAKAVTPPKHDDQQQTAQQQTDRQKPTELAELRHANSQMESDIKALRANLEALRSAARQDKTAGEVRALEADLKNVKSGLTSARTQADAAIAQLAGKVDKLQHEPPPKPVAALGQVEHQATDKTPTGSIGAGATSVAKAVPTPPVKPTTTKLASADEGRRAVPDESATKPQVLSGWVVRDVYDGVALIEGKRGPMEVVPGVSVPGAGVVKSIDRHGNGWTVTTSKGLLAYAAPPRDYRRVNSREYYPEYPSGY